MVLCGRPCRHRSDLFGPLNPFQLAGVSDSLRTHLELVSRLRGVVWVPGAEQPG